MASALLIVVVFVAGGCGDDEEQPTQSDPQEPALSAELGPAPTAGKAGEEGRKADGRPRSGSQLEGLARRVLVGEATRSYRKYVAAINARDGDALCRLIEPGVVKELRPPGAGACPERLGAAIGFADPRGFPVWEETVFEGIESSAAGSRLRVRLTASILTRFADRPEPSIESDVAYLRPTLGEYRLVRATGALWRAVGKPDVPPAVIAPPPGFESLSGGR